MSASNIPVRAARALAAVVVLTFGATGCGGNETPLTPEQAAAKEVFDADSAEAKKIDPEGWKLGQPDSNGYETYCEGTALTRNGYHASRSIPFSDISNCADGDPRLSPNEARRNVWLREQSLAEVDRFSAR